MRQFSPLRGALCRMLPDRIPPQPLGTCAPRAFCPIGRVRNAAVLAAKTAAGMPHCLELCPLEWMAGGPSSFHRKTNVDKSPGPWPEETRPRRSRDADVVEPTQVQQSTRRGALLRFWQGQCSSRAVIVSPTTEVSRMSKLKGIGLSCHRFQSQRSPSTCTSNVDGDSRAASADRLSAGGPTTLTIYI
jgi:hypothetical protein